MTNPAAVEKFTGEFERRFQELSQWAIENWPDKNRPLSEADLADMHKEFSKVKAKASLARQRVPEPWEGGPQYVNQTPTPWP